MNHIDTAETGRLAEAIKKLLPALENFNRFEGRDGAGRRHDLWKAALNQPLPQRGAGIKQVLRELATTIIPNGLRVGAPGFCGWVAVAPTTSGAAAALAGTVAGPQRWWVQPFNYLETVALRWLAELLDIPREMQGTFTSGGLDLAIYAMIPETKYTKSGNVHIAYQVVGDGPIDLVIVPGWVSNIDVIWEEPAYVRFLQRLASFSRLLLFDKRGTGLSDRVTSTPTLEERMDDVRAVMDAVSSERAALLGYSAG
jgi:hypothetical protein